MEQQYDDNEISLRELIEILMSGWKFILVIPLLVGIITYSYTKYAIEPTYESQSTLQVHVSNTNSDISTNSVDDILNTKSFTPEYSIESYIQQIGSPEVLLPAMKALELENTYNYEEFKNKLTIAPIKNSSLIMITAKDSTPKTAALIVNTVSESFIEHVSSKQVEQLDSSTQLLTAQLAVEKEKLDTALQASKEFDSKERNINLVDQELSLSLNQFNRSKSELAILSETYEKSKYSMTQDIAISKKKIVAYNDLLQETDKVFQLNKDIYDSSVSSVLVSSENMPVEEQNNFSVLTDELNPVYISNLSTLNNEQIRLVNLEKSLEKLTNMYNYNFKTLTEKTSTLEGNINTLRGELAELTYEKRLLDEAVTIAQNTYGAFNKKLESARVAKAANISDASVLWMSKGYAASAPIGPRKVFNTLISMVLAGMLAVFTLFFKHYWKHSSATTK